MHQCLGGGHGALLQRLLSSSPALRVPHHKQLECFGPCEMETAFSPAKRFAAAAFAPLLKEGGCELEAPCAGKALAQGHCVSEQSLTGSCSQPHLAALQEAVAGLQAELTRLMCK